MRAARVLLGLLTAALVLSAATAAAVFAEHVPAVAGAKATATQDDGVLHHRGRPAMPALKAA